MQKELDVQKLDERNIAIGNRAKAKAYNFMTPLFSALLLAFALMGVDLIPLLLLLFAYLLVQVYALYYRFKYDKEM